MCSVGRFQVARFAMGSTERWRKSYSFVQLSASAPSKPRRQVYQKRRLNPWGSGSAKEKTHRQALKTNILKEIRPHKPGTETFPGLGPHSGLPVHQQFEIPISETVIKEVSAKIVQGCEYVLGGERFIEEAYELSIYFAHEHKIEDVLRLFNSFGPIQLGPGFAVRRAPARDDPKSVLCKIDIWGTWTIYASIIPR
jgi:hypothetical protein